MGVYIGMEMPTKENAVILITPSGDVWMIGDMPNEDTHLVKAKAVPVPPHGRLIDADALLMRINHEVMEAYMDGACYGVHPSQEYLYILGEIIDEAPAVIPASEEGEA